MQLVGYNVFCPIELQISFLQCPNQRRVSGSEFRENMGAKTVIQFPVGKSARILKWTVKEGSYISLGRVILLYDLDPDSGGGEQKKLKAKTVGVVSKLLAKEGEIIEPGHELLELEDCSHATVMNAMCAECGADLREDESQTEGKASVPMVHSIPELKVSKEQAETLGKADEERLLGDRKLVLLVDLDQTLIHTTNDNIPPNLKDVYHFQLYGPQSPWYHTRIRPGTQKFLSEMSKLYELHICTFGARNYAHTIAMFLDPDGRYFSHRILSRDECFSQNSKTANLKALFPCGDNLVCIIDDREDVWNYAANLIHVKPYHFFQHTGDINAPPGLAKCENDDKEGFDFSKFGEKMNKISVKEEDNKNNKGEHHEKDNCVSNSKKNSKEITSTDTTGLTNGMNEGSVFEEKNTETTLLEQSLSEVKEPRPDVRSTEKNLNKDISDEMNKEISDKGSSGETNKESSDESVKESSGEWIKESSGESIKERSGEANKDCSCETNKDSCGETNQDHSGETNRESSGETNKESSCETNKESSCETNKESSGETNKGSSGETNKESSGETNKESSGETNKESSGETNKESSGETNRESGEIVSSETGDRVGNSITTDDRTSEISNSNGDSVKEPENETKKSEGPKLEDVKDSVEQKSDVVEVEDGDDYLMYLEEILRTIHHAFYELFDQLGGKVPDLKLVVPYVRRKVLTGTSLVLSGLVPTHVPLESSRVYQLAVSLGAEVTPTITSRSTHLVAVRPGTAKVHQARKEGLGKIKLVSPEWLWSCAERWEHVDERLFPLQNKGASQASRHPPAHCGSPNRLGRFMDTINPLMSFSSEEIANMDKEVEDIFNESESGGETKSEKVIEDSSSDTIESLSEERPHGWKEPKQKRRAEDLDEDSPSSKFRRGEALPSDLDLGDDDSVGSDDPPDEVDDGDWNMMGAALEREFLSGE